MIDYAISPIGRGDGAPLASPMDSAIRFEEIAGRKNNLWSDDSGNPIKIIRQPSSAGMQTAADPPWHSVASYVEQRLDSVRHQWSKVESSLPSSDEPRNNENSISAIRRILDDSYRFQKRLIKFQVSVALVNATATVMRKGITALYRQQG